MITRGDDAAPDVPPYRPSMAEAVKALEGLGYQHG